MKKKLAELIAKHGSYPVLDELGKHFLESSKCLRTRNNVIANNIAEELEVVSDVINSIIEEHNQNENI